ncbi:DsbA family protein [Spirosoma flavum]|uniref:DsbA family protein n=1 Tax=Spirosoma flavum TaxID=2048557 RepID=A0ABW6AI50_9BACT
MHVHERNFTRTLDPNPLDLIEYGDFSCRRCQELQKVLTTVLPLFEGRIRYTFRHFPNPDHPQAFLLALTAEAARRQDQYWAMHQALFAHAVPLSLNSVVRVALT